MPVNSGVTIEQVHHAGQLAAIRAIRNKARQAAGLPEVSNYDMAQWWRGLNAQGAEALLWYYSGIAGAYATITDESISVGILPAYSGHEADVLAELEARAGTGWARDDQPGDTATLTKGKPKVAEVKPTSSSKSKPKTTTKRSATKSRKSKED